MTTPVVGPAGGDSGTPPAPSPELRIGTLDGWHLRAVRVPGGGVIVTLERVIASGRDFRPVSFERRISEGQARALRDWLNEVLESARVEVHPE